MSHVHSRFESRFERRGLARAGFAALLVAWVSALPAGALAAPADYPTSDVLLFPDAPSVLDTVTVFARGFVATPCDSFLGAERSGPASIRIRTQVYDARACLVAPFQFFSVPVVMGRFPAGTNRIEIERQVIHVGTDGSRDTIGTRIALFFDVSETRHLPAPIPAEQLPFVLQVGTVPNPPCPTQSTTLHLAGVFPDGCGRVVSVDPGTLSLVIAPYPPAPTPCTLALKPWKRTSHWGCSPPAPTTWRSR